MLQLSLRGFVVQRKPTTYSTYLFPPYSHNNAEAMITRGALHLVWFSQFYWPIVIGHTVCTYEPLTKLNKYAASVFHFGSCAVWIPNERQPVLLMRNVDKKWGLAVRATRLVSLSTHLQITLHIRPGKAMQILLDDRQSTRSEGFNSCYIPPTNQQILHCCRQHIEDKSYRSLSSW